MSNIDRIMDDLLTEQHKLIGLLKKDEDPKLLALQEKLLNSINSIIKDISKYNKLKVSETKLKETKLKENKKSNSEYLY
jgi:hypothetical protein